MLLLDRPSRNEVRLPKGHMEPGESPAEAALRETQEETGYGQLEIWDDLGCQQVEFDYRGNHYIRTEHYFLMRLAGPHRVPRPPDDQADFTPIWVPLEEAVARLTFDSEKAMAERAITAYRRRQQESPTAKTPQRC